MWRFQNYGDCGYTCNPHKFEIIALWFPCRVPVIPCKHLQCISRNIVEWGTNSIGQLTNGLFWSFELYQCSSFTFCSKQFPILDRFFLYISKWNYSVAISNFAIIEEITSGHLYKSGASFFARLLENYCVDITIVHIRTVNS